jgi:hypothetical protein
LVTLRKLANELSQIFIWFQRPYLNRAGPNKGQGMPVAVQTFLTQASSDIGGIRCTLRKRTDKLQEHKARLGHNEDFSSDMHMASILLFLFLVYYLQRTYIDLRL